MNITKLPSRAAGFRHFHLESVGSTNEVLVDLAHDGDPGRLWLTAGEQTRGKGSRGRDWRSVPGNLYASLLLRNPSKKSVQHQLTFVAAISARAAVEAVTGGNAEIEVKWPNDLMINGKKCGGILLESGEFNRLSYVIVGMGINCTSFPEYTLHPSSSFKDEGFEVSPEKLFGELSSEFAERLNLWAEGNNFDPVREQWLQHAFGLGDPVSVVIPGEGTVEGRFATIDAYGYMMLETDSGQVRKISTADIFFSAKPPKGE